jgi:signal transduction histidine kinase/DNA-binding response OmpR family regulator
LSTGDLLRFTIPPPVLYAGVFGLVAAVFIVDMFTMLGIVVWILYVLPLALTLAGRNPGLPVITASVCSVLILVTLLTGQQGVPLWMAAWNRVFGGVVLWTIALLARAFIAGRERIEEEAWSQAVHTRLLEAMQGEPSLSELGERALSVIAEATGCPVAALYAHEGDTLRLAATKGLRPGVDLPRTFSVGEGVTGEAVRTGGMTVLRDLPPAFFTVRGSLGEASPGHLVVSALRVDGETQGVLEAAFLRAPEPRVLTLLDRSRHAIAVAIRTAFFRDRLRALLEETRQQAAELGAQQERLRATNEALEEQSRILRVSQATLEEQQTELEATNAQLEAQARDLELQQHALTRAMSEVERASQYKSEFLANMSHELRTPLNSTLILAKLLSENKSGRLSAEDVRYAETIHASGQTLLTLINDILDLSKIEAGAVDIRPDTIRVAALVDDLHRRFQPIAADKQLEFAVDLLPAVTTTLTSDSHRLLQILTNLLSNAFKFTERGGVVLRVAPAGPDQVAFEVRDTGIGIPAEHQHGIFEAFRQADGSTHRKYGGTGLGLSISRELAHMLGGSIQLSSTPGLGSTFTLIMPVRPPAATPTHRTLASQDVFVTRSPLLRAAARADALEPAVTPDPLPSLDDRLARQRPGRLILVVEDDPDFAQILYGLAHELDFDCVVARTNDEGMVLARDLLPSGILLDLHLPDGSGLTLLDRLKRNPDTRHIPVHMVSVSDRAHPALTMGAVGYALKPVAREELVKAIRKLEDRLDGRLRRVLVVEDDDVMRDSITELLRLDGVRIHAVGTAAEALAQLAAESFDCVVLDLHLPDASGYEILETMSTNETYSFPPVIVYTGRAISSEEEEALRRFSRSVIVKGARSPERLLDEVTLFLHQVESRLPPGARRLLEAARERDEFFEGRTILVVEDDVRNVFALTSVFEPRGARVMVARNGRDAIAEVQKCRPDLVLMDIMMPEMDGLAATRALRAYADLRDLPIIALTAKAMPDDYEQCLAAGANDYLAKPLDIDKLLSLCRVWMRR